MAGVAGVVGVVSVAINVVAHGVTGGWSGGFRLSPMAAMQGALAVRLHSAEALTQVLLLVTSLEAILFDLAWGRCVCLCVKNR